MSARRRRAAQIKAKKEPEVVEKEKGKVTSVQIFKKSLLEVPELFIKVYISEKSHEKAMGNLFARARCYKADTPEEADIVVFCGGPDVNPTIYHEEPHATYRGDDARDKRDLELYAKCVAAGIPMVGICRGAQLLGVANGAKLIQDMDKHRGDHGMVLERGQSLTSSMYIGRVSSTHHQAVIEDDKMTVLAYSYQSERRHLNPTVSQAGRTKDVEAFFYRDTCSLGFQGHPEFAGYYQYTQWFFHMVEKFICHNSNIKIVDGMYRHQRPVLLGLPGPIQA